jgi:hypothetical protein
MVVYVKRDSSNSLLFRGSASESFMFEGILQQMFDNKWKSEQTFTSILYTVGCPEYELTIIMKTLELATKGKIKYVK